MARTRHLALMLGLALAAGPGGAAPAPEAAPAESAGREAARELAGALLQVQGSRRGDRVLNPGLSSGFLWPHAACPGRYALTVRHGVQGGQAGPEGEFVHDDASPLGAQVRVQMARRAGQAPASGPATVIAVGERLGSGQDWALLRLEQALPGRALPPARLAGGPPRPGQALRLLALPADAVAAGPEPRAALEAPCQATEHDPDFEGWRSTCRGAAGQSGGPVLFGPGPGTVAAAGDGPEPGWRLGGLVVSRREGPGQAKAVLLSLHAVAPAVEAAIAADRRTQACEAGPAAP